MRPDPGAAILLAEPVKRMRFTILKPDLDPTVCGEMGYVRRERAREVFLNCINYDLI